MKEELQEIECCGDCPFMYFDMHREHYCNEIDNDKDFEIKDTKELLNDCPLKDKQITIKLKQNGSKNIQ